MTVIGLIAFIIYTSLIFFIKEYYLLAGSLIINIILMFILKINIKKASLFILKLLPFILFTAIFNLIFGDVKLSTLVSLRLILVCNITYVFSCKMTPKKIQYGVEKILSPLKIFKINTRDIGVMVSISLSFIPILQKEIQNLKYSLISKGFNLNLKNLIKKPNYILVPLLTSVIKKTAEIEQSMISKGYIS